jgi:glutathione synthase/RimK-type ligase-like ATP-grasp enzyme
VNHPARDEAATHKPWQLAVAQRSGLRVPRTCITSDPARARAFVERLRPGRAVFKSLQATAADWRPTRLVGARELGRLEIVRYAPVVFQEYVEPGADVRVTAVGRRLFAAAIHVAGTDHAADFRPGYDQVRVEPIRLPAELAARLRRLLAALGLAYAAIDLRRDPAGEYHFLEVNPSGQWLFVEERTGQPITAAVARLLATGR